MGVAQCPYVTGSDGSAYYISAVPAWGCGAQDRRYVEIVLYRTGAFYAVKTLQGELLVQTAVLFVEGVAELLKYDYRVGKNARMLPFGHHFREYTFDIGHVEVSAEHKRARAPVIAAQKRMHIAHAAAPGGRVA